MTPRDAERDTEAGPIRRDYRAAAVRSMVVMGESNAYGISAVDPRNEWVQVVAGLIRHHQDGYLRVLNNAIPSNVISPRAPGYEPFRGDYATAPAATERFEVDMLAHRPDLAVYAYGLNDARCGHSPESFLADYESIVAATRSALPESLIVLVGPYWNPQFEADLWVDPRYDAARLDFGKFALGGDSIVLAYNEGIANLARRFDCLFVDLYPSLRGAGWLIHDDACHFTDVGHQIIGSLVFVELATRTSFLAVKSTEAFRDGGFSTRNTGGTNGLPAVVNTWRYLPEGRTPWR